MRAQRLILILCLATVILGLCSGAPAWAQSEATSGTLRGTVSDASGGLVPGATVRVKNLETGYTRETQTGDDGYFNIPLLPVGLYELRVEKQGFSTLVQSNLQVSIGVVTAVNVELKLGAATEVIEVKGAAPLVETTRTQVSAVVDDTAVRALPLHGRNYLEFVLLTPGVVRDNGGARPGDINFGGLKGTLNSLQVDGVDNNNNFFGQGLGRPGSRAPFQFSQEAVAEFQVKTNSYGAEFGRAGGAVINVVTKSGTNDWHGALFTYFRDNKLNANKWELNRRGTAKPPLRNWQFGALASGPLVRDKVFWLFNYDGQRRSDPNPIICPFAPSDPNAAACAAAAADAFIGPKIKDYQKTLNQDVYLAKGDWRITNNHNLSVRYNYQGFTGGGFEAGRATSVFEHTGDSLVRSHTLSGNLVSTFGPRWINEFRAQWSRDGEPGLANGSGPELLFQAGGTTFLELGRNNFSPRETTIRGGQFVDNVTFLRGRHTFKFGADFNIQRILNNFPGLFAGQYIFASVADFSDRIPNGNAPGGVGSFSQAFAGTATTGPVTHPNFIEYAWFVQDEIRAGSNLTLTLGVRYDRQSFNKPSITNPDPQLAALGINTGQMNTDTNNLGPRFGFAWSPHFYSRQTVVRGGYGIYYGRIPSIMTGTATAQNGIQVVTFSRIPGNNAVVPAYPGILSGPPTTVAAAKPSLYAFEQTFVNPYVQQGSLGVETEVAKDWSAGITYLFVKGTHLARSNNINVPNPTTQALPVAGSGAATVTVERFLVTVANPLPDANFGRITLFQSNANSMYHAAVFALNKRFSHHFQAGANYTFSKTIDDRPDFTSVVPGNVGDDSKMVPNPKNIAQDRGPSDQDYRQRFTLLYAWNLDYLNKHDNFLVRHAFGHWSFSGILTAQNGRHYSTLLGGDPNSDGNRQNDRAFGVGRNTNTLPAMVSFDIRLGHDFPVYERAKFIFLFEAFNLFNHPNFSDVNMNQFNLAPVSTASGSTSLPSPNCPTVGQLCFFPQSSFGTFVATYDHPGGGGIFPGPGPRTLQLAIKLTW